ncbi:hypothetical protein NPIL_656791 [Nephila pilipes]|uniref:Ubiquitin-like protease family profile domain-containing protein n=1 Tax=Nephila pilipes TaxID=299642 RepID=A0A8X6PHU5_NEPPI|nr:hypothetical protein NPIL_656791 [Nephila pilipes]
MATTKILANNKDLKIRKSFVIVHYQSKFPPGYIYVRYSDAKRVESEDQAPKDVASKCVGRSKWLNDVLIDYYMEYIYDTKLTEDQKGKTYILNSYFYPSLIHAINRNHGKACIYVFDSIYNYDRGEAAGLLLRNYLQAMHKAQHGFDKDFTKMKIFVVQSPQQCNFYDCGLYLLKNVEMFFKNTSLFNTPMPDVRNWFSQADIYVVRREIYAAICSSLKKRFNDIRAKKEQECKKQLSDNGLVFSDKENAALLVHNLESSFQENSTPYDDDLIEKTESMVQNYLETHTNFNSPLPLK